MKKIISTIIVIALLGAATTIKNIESTNYGTLITFKNNTGYFIEKNKI